MTTNPSSPENGRLRDRNDQPILAEGEDVHFIATLGANGVIDSGPLEREHDAELVLNLKDFYTATLSVQVEATEHDGSVDPITGEATVRVFAPHPSNPEQIQVYKGIHIPDSDSSPQPTAVVVSVPNLTIGARIVRAYLSDGRKSVVRQVVLRPGANFIQLKIDR